MVDPSVLTAKALIVAGIGYEVVVHTIVWKRLPEWATSDGFSDRFLVTVASLFALFSGFIALIVLYWFFFVWS